MNYIPLFPDFREIELYDKPLFDRYLKNMNPLASEFTFTNIFIFKNIHSYSVTSLNNNICLLGKSYKGELYFLPPFGNNKIEETISELFKFLKNIGENPLLCMVDDNYIFKYIKGNDRYRYILDRDNFDYIYLTEDLINLKGNKYHKKKNLINQFVKKYIFRYDSLCRVVKEHGEWLEEDYKNIQVLKSRTNRTTNKTSNQSLRQTLNPKTK